MFNIYSKFCNLIVLLINLPFFEKASFQTSIGPRTILRGKENIILGKNVRFVGDSFFSSVMGKMVIKNNVAFNRNVFINSDNGGYIEIGSNVMIGPNCVMRASDHNFENKVIFKNSGHKPGRIIIGDNVWISSSVVILNNVEIKKNIVLGAGSVVTKSISKSGLYCGNPAKFIRSI